MNILLRHLEEVDLEMVRKWRNSKEVAQLMYTENHITSSQQKEWFDKVKKSSDSKYWIIEYRETPVGLAYITEINNEFKRCSFGFYIVDLSIRGAVIGIKTEYKLMEYVFNDMDFNKLTCEVLVSNAKTIIMHEKVGFTREAYYKEHAIKNGIKIDVVGLAILKSEWNKLKEKSIFSKYE